MSGAVWREDVRIRREDGCGYADFVDDDTIQEHIDEHSRLIARAEADIAERRDSVEFAAAVLAYRAGERMARAVASSGGGTQ